MKRLPVRGPFGVALLPAAGALLVPAASAAGPVAGDWYLAADHVPAVQAELPAAKRLHYRGTRTGWYYLEVDVRGRTNAGCTLSYATTS